MQHTGCLRQRIVARSPNDNDIEMAYAVMAAVVRDHGETYLPIFERLHKELEARKSNRALLAIALKTADNLIQ